MKQVISAVIAVVEGLAVALCSAIFLGVSTLVFWLIQFGIGAKYDYFLTVLSSLWLLGHGVPLGLSIGAEQAVSFGFDPEKISWTFSLPITGIMLITAWRAFINGWRLRANLVGTIVHTVSAAIGFSLVSILMVVFALPLIDAGLILAVLLPAVFVIICYFVGGLTRRFVQENLWESVVRPYLVKNPAVTWVTDVGYASVVLACRISFGLLAVSAVCTGFAVVASFTGQLRVLQSLQLDFAGVLVIGILTIAYLPTMVLWSLAWLTGGGFSVGIGTSVSPFAQLVGPVPAIPVFAMLPHGWGSWALLAPAILFVTVFVVTVLSAKKSPWAHAPVLHLLLGSFAVALFVGCVSAGLFALARGSIGPGRLSLTGPDVLLASGLLAGIVFFGVLFGALGRRADVLWLEPLQRQFDAGVQARETKRRNRWIGLGEPFGQDANTEVLTEKMETTDLAPTLAVTEKQADVIEFSTGQIVSNPKPVKTEEPEIVHSVETVHEQKLYDSVLQEYEIQAKAASARAAENADAEAIERAFEWNAGGRLPNVQNTIAQADKALADKSEKENIENTNSKASFWNFWRR